MSVGRFLMAMGWAGLLIIIIDLAMLTVFLINLIRRRGSRKLLWMGGGTVALGVIGTALWVLLTYRIIAEKGGAGSPADLTDGLQNAAVPSILGVASMVLALILTGILQACRRGPEREGAGAGKKEA